MSLHRVLRTAWDMDALNEGASVVALNIYCSTTCIS